MNYEGPAKIMLNGEVVLHTEHATIRTTPEPVRQKLPAVTQRFAIGRSPALAAALSLAQNGVTWVSPRTRQVRRADERRAAKVAKRDALIRAQHEEYRRAHGIR